MNNEFEYAIVGGGGMGSAAAYFLAREGKSVIVFEQFEVGHTRGSSFGESRMIRYSYEQVEYVKLAKFSYKLWAEVEEEFGQKLVNKTGGLDLGYSGDTDLDLCIQSLTREKVEHEILDSTELQKRFPQFNVENVTRGLYQKDGGYLEPDLCVPAFIKLARKHGAEVKDNCPVDSITLSNQGAEVKAGVETYSSKKLIITAGAWAGPFLATMGVRVPIVVTLEQFAFFRPKAEEPFEPGRFPVFYCYTNPTDVSRLYGCPLYGGLGVKVGEHQTGAETTARSRSFEADPEKLARLSKRALKLIPDLTPEMTKTTTCLYSNTPDKHFIIDRLPGHDNVIIAAGFSGHGFKFVPAVGAILKDLAMDKQPPVPLNLFPLSRFAALKA